MPPIIPIIQNNEITSVITSVITSHNSRIQCLLSTLLKNYIGIESINAYNSPVINTTGSARSGPFRRTNGLMTSKLSTNSNTNSSSNASSNTNSNLKVKANANVSAKDTFNKINSEKIRFQNCAVIRLEIDNTGNSVSNQSNRSKFSKFNIELIYEGELTDEETNTISKSKPYWSIKNKNKDGYIKFNSFKGDINNESFGLLNKKYIFYIIRHGQGKHNEIGKNKISKILPILEYIIMRNSILLDPVLTETGMQQADKVGIFLGNYLKNYKINFLFVSDLIRTSMTLFQICSTLNSTILPINLDFKVLPCNHEISYDGGGKECNKKTSINPLTPENTPDIEILDHKILGPKIVLKKEKIYTSEDCKKEKIYPNERDIQMVAFSDTEHNTFIEFRQKRSLIVRKNNQNKINFSLLSNPIYNKIKLGDYELRVDRSKIDWTDYYNYYEKKTRLNSIEKCSDTNLIIQAIKIINSSLPINA